MVAKGKEKTERKANKNRVEVLNLNRETIKDLTSTEQKGIKGGGGARSGVDMKTLTDRSADR